ncbi:hypothetical protein [uncultured Aquimarina sp.]|uniref:hypothetical protein n=1 Tax=uncultured Aquimarina sp. TaxID=575652 RepID=UPI0026142B34|nr:hypothetical protein [uncultured Aquimarina sp.]
MKELKTYNKYFLDGSSLIESVIAISIIATCLLVAIRLYAAVLNSSSSLNSYRMKFKVAELFNDTRIARDFDDELYEFKTYSIKKVVEDFQSNNELKNIKFIVQTTSDTIIYNYLLANKKRNE